MERLKKKSWRNKEELHGKAITFTVYEEPVNLELTKDRIVEK